MWDKIWNDIIIPVLKETYIWINQLFVAIPEYKTLIISFFVIFAISRFILFPLLGISNSVFRQEIAKGISRKIKKPKSKPKSKGSAGSNKGD